MKKRLLFALMAMCMAVSGFALTQGEFVYTPQGRFQITGDNLNANNSFADFSGWTVATATEGKTIAEIFNMNANGYAEGMNSVQSIDATAGEGMYFKFVPTSASDTYVVSFKMKGAFAVSTRVKDEEATMSKANVVKVQGNTDGVFGGTTDVLTANTAEELTENWQTFNYAIVGDGTPRTYFISFTGMATTVEIADVQIAPAIQFADLRQRDAMVEKINAYKNVYAWSEDVLAEFAITEVLGNLASVGDETGQAVLDEFLSTADETLTDFLKENMEDYIAGNNDNYLGIKTTSGNTQKATKLGDWTCVDRGFWSNGAYPDLGHYQQTNSWANGNPTNAMGVTLQKDLTPGSYVFAIEANAAFRENVKQSWYIDEGMAPAYGVAYIVKVVDGAAADTVKAVVKDLEPVNYTPFFVPVTITDEGTYEIGYKSYCKAEYQSLKLGSVTYVRNASVWGKNDNKYTQAELAYEGNVRTQITTGRTNLTTAAENIANAEKPWGKPELQACVDTIAPRIEAYEAMSQDEIIATFDKDIYENSTSSENGLLQYEVYQQATKWIIAANRKFDAVNDTLATMQTAIEAAETVLGQRIYDAATGKAALQAAIETAKGVQAQMKAALYSEENAAAVVAANATLAEAVEAFKASVPADAVTSLVDIDFTKDAVQDEITLLYTIPGNAGTMEFSAFSPDGSNSDAFEKGLLSNGERLYSNYVRVGNGTGTVNFNAGDMGTDILRFNFDFYLQGLSGRSIGFFIKGQGTDAEGNPADVDVAKFYANYYNNTISDNTFGIALGSLKYGSGSSYNDAAPEGAEGAGSTVCAKNSFEVILDFGEKSMYCVTTSGNGTVTTHKYEFDGTVPTSFVLQCNYQGFGSRRCWFSNLKIQRIQAGATDPYVGINNAKAVKAEAPVKVFENGQIIIGGKYGANGALVK